MITSQLLTLLAAGKTRPQRNDSFRNTSSSTAIGLQNHSCFTIQLTRRLFASVYSQLTVQLKPQTNNVVSKCWHVLLIQIDTHTNKWGQSLYPLGRTNATHGVHISVFHLKKKSNSWWITFLCVTAYML